jgi:Ni,Fe-hydrogenase I cytochrome b subunit
MVPERHYKYVEQEDCEGNLALSMMKAIYVSYVPISSSCTNPLIDSENLLPYLLMMLLFLVCGMILYGKSTKT